MAPAVTGGCTQIRISSSSSSSMVMRTRSLPASTPEYSVVASSVRTRDAGPRSSNRVPVCFGITACRAISDAFTARGMVTISTVSSPTKHASSTWTCWSEVTEMAVPKAMVALRFRAKAALRTLRCGGGSSEVPRTSITTFVGVSATACENVATTWESCHGGWTLYRCNKLLHPRAVLVNTISF